MVRLGELLLRQPDAVSPSIFTCDSQGAVPLKSRWCTLAAQLSWSKSTSDGGWRRGGSNRFRTERLQSSCVAISSSECRIYYPAGHQWICGPCGCHHQRRKHNGGWGLDVSPFHSAIPADWVDARPRHLRSVHRFLLLHHN